MSQCTEKTFNNIAWQSEHPFHVYASLFNALETTNNLVFSIKKNLKGQCQKNEVALNRLKIEPIYAYTL